MFWIMRYKVDKVLRNGDTNQDSGCTLYHHQAMPDQWHWCSTHALAMYHHSSMSNSMIFRDIQEKPTDLDAPEPEWKYLSSFTVWKGPNKTGIKGVMDRLIAPQQGPATAIPMPSPPDVPIQPAAQQQDHQAPIVDDDYRSIIRHLSCLSHSRSNNYQQLARCAVVGLCATLLTTN